MSFTQMFLFTSEARYIDFLFFPADVTDRTRRYDSDSDLASKRPIAAKAYGNYLVSVSVFGRNGVGGCHGTARRLFHS